MRHARSLLGEVFAKAKGVELGKAGLFCEGVRERGLTRQAATLPRQVWPGQGGLLLPKRSAGGALHLP